MLLYEEVFFGKKIAVNRRLQTVSLSVDGIEQDSCKSLTASFSLYCSLETKDGKKGITIRTNSLNNLEVLCNGKTISKKMTSGWGWSSD